MRMIAVFALVAVFLSGCAQNSQVDTALSQADNTQRTNDINALLQAISRYELERQVVLVEPGMGETDLASDGVDICPEIVPDYLAAIPVDPDLNRSVVSDCSENYDSGYTVSRDASGTLVIRAPRSELGVVIEARGVK